MLIIILIILLLLILIIILMILLLLLIIIINEDNLAVELRLIIVMVTFSGSVAVGKQMKGGGVACSLTEDPTGKFGEDESSARSRPFVNLSQTGWGSNKVYIHIYIHRLYNITIVYIYIYIYVYTCKYLYIYLYTHTCIHILYNTCQ